jgi:hypothetical protein
MDKNKTEKENSDEKDKRIEFIAPVWMFKRWKKRALVSGFKSLGGYIRMVMNTYKPPGSHPVKTIIEPQFAENEAQLKLVKNNLIVLKNEIMAELGPYGKSHKKLQERIMMELEKHGEMDEFALAENIQEDPDIVFTILSYLKSSNQVKHSKNLRWSL